MNDIEDRLQRHLSDRASEVTPFDTFEDIVSDRFLVSVSEGQRRRSWPRVALGAAAAVLVVAGVAVVSQRDGGTDAAAGSPAPLPTGVPLTGVEWTRAGHIELEAARRVLLQECMRRAGFQVPLGIDDMVLSMGAWTPHPVLGIGTQEAAASYGYHHPPASDPAGSSNQSTGYSTALMGAADAPMVDVTLPDGTPTGTQTSNGGGCLGEIDAAFDGLLDQQEALRIFVTEQATDSVALAEQTLNDQRVTSALEGWRNCVSETGGDDVLGGATTPNQLARRYAVTDGEATPEETQVAVIDARCQHQTDLQTTWYQVYAEYQRAALVQHQDWFDLLATMRMQIVARAAELLDERGFDAIAPSEPGS